MNKAVWLSTISQLGKGKAFGGAPRKGHYKVPRLIEKYRPQANMMKMEGPHALKSRGKTLSTLSPRKCRLLRPKRQRKAFGLSLQNFNGTRLSVLRRSLRLPRGEWDSRGRTL